MKHQWEYKMAEMHQQEIRAEQRMEMKIGSVNKAREDVLESRELSLMDGATRADDDQDLGHDEDDDDHDTDAATAAATITFAASPAASFTAAAARVAVLQRRSVGRVCCGARHEGGAQAAG